MNPFASAVVTAVLALAACAPQVSAAPQPAAALPHGKPSAPVTVDAQLSGGSAHVTVRFDGDAKDVRVEVHGADGLQVTSVATPIQQAKFARGEVTTLDVTFTPGPGRSYLAVAVSGKFHGAGHRASVASFAVGEPTAEQLKGPGTIVESPDGERLHVVVPGK
jgi:hypothetical protein